MIEIILGVLVVIGFVKLWSDLREARVYAKHYKKISEELVDKNYDLSNKLNGQQYSINLANKCVKKNENNK